MIVSGYISCQNPFSARTSWIRAFECQKIMQPLRCCSVLCIERSVSQPVYGHAQLTRCFSAVAELLVTFIWQFSQVKLCFIERFQTCMYTISLFATKNSVAVYLYVERLFDVKIRFRPTLCGGSLGRGRQTILGVVDDGYFGDLGGCVFENFRDTASDIIWRYATACRPVNDCKMNDLEWPSSGY